MASIDEALNNLGDSMSGAIMSYKREKSRKEQEKTLADLIRQSSQPSFTEQEFRLSPAGQAAVGRSGRVGHNILGIDNSGNPIYEQGPVLDQNIMRSEYNNESKPDLAEIFGSAAANPMAGKALESKAGQDWFNQIEKASAASQRAKLLGLGRSGAQGETEALRQQRLGNASLQNTMALLYQKAAEGTIDEKGMRILHLLSSIQQRNNEQIGQSINPFAQ